MGRGHPRGQAAIESALTLPLVVFMALGTLQLFLMLQARILTEYAAYQATRSGSMRHGDCGPMTDAALLALLPSVTRTDSPGALTAAFSARRLNRYSAGLDGVDLPIVELVRDSPSRVPVPEDPDFDQPGRLSRLELRVLYWYHLDIPFADWVTSRMFLAYLGLQAYDAVNPLMPAESKAGWTAGGALEDEGWPGGAIGPRLRSAVLAGKYVFPIRASASMRMMTPAKARHFAAAGCPL